jgi:hypothetical protein
MSDQPTTDNTAANIVDTIIVTAAEAGEAAAEAAAFTYVPFLNYPIIKQLFEAAMDWLNQFMRKPVELGATILIIQFETAEEKFSFISATQDLQVAQTGGDPLQIQAARLAFADAASKLIHIDGSATPK